MNDLVRIFKYSCEGNFFKFAGKPSVMGFDDHFEWFHKMFKP